MTRRGMNGGCRQITSKNRNAETSQPRENEYNTATIARRWI